MFYRIISNHRKIVTIANCIQIGKWNLCENNGEKWYCYLNYSIQMISCTHETCLNYMYALCHTRQLFIGWYIGLLFQECFHWKWCDTDVSKKANQENTIIQTNDKQTNLFLQWISLHVTLGKQPISLNRWQISWWTKRIEDKNKTNIRDCVMFELSISDRLSKLNAIVSFFLLFKTNIRYFELEAKVIHSLLLLLASSMA